MNRINIKWLIVVYIFFLPKPAYCFPHNQIIDSIRVKYQTSITTASDSLELLDACFDYGEYLESEDESEDAIIQMKIALRIAANIGNDDKIATVTNSLARIYWMTGDYEASSKIYKTGLQSAERAHDSSVIAKISMNLANNYNYSGDYDNAIKYAIQALAIKERSNNLERICYHYVSAGNIFKETNNTAKWEEYILKAYRMKDIEGCASVGDIAKIYNGLGGIAMVKNEEEKALLYYDTLMVISKEANFSQGISTSLSNSANVYKKTGKPQKALELIVEAEKYFGDNPYEIIFSNNFKAELYMALGDNEKALGLVRENIKEEEINYYSSEKLRCLELLYELNFKLSNYKEAFSWNDSLRKTEKQFRDEDVRKAIEEIETRYQTEQKEQKINLLTAENKIKTQRMRLAWQFVGFLFVLIFLVLVLLQFIRKQAAYKQSELQQQLLRSQMNPHFIFNVMGSIQSFLFKNEAGKAADYLSKFASLSRSVLEFSSRENISLEKEIEMLQNYIELERARVDPPFEVEYFIDPEMEIEFIEIPPMLLQPFVENAVKHGLHNLDYPGKLSLRFEEKQDYIVVEIIDNGSGLMKNRNSNHKSKGIEIFQERKKGIERKLKKEVLFDIQNLNTIDKAKHGVRVFIQIPVLNND